MEDFLLKRTRDGFIRRGVRMYHVVFTIEHNTYLNMMCRYVYEFLFLSWKKIFEKKTFRYTYVNNPKSKGDPCDTYSSSFGKTIVRRDGSRASTGDGWSWLCCNYLILNKQTNL